MAATTDPLPPCKHLTHRTVVPQMVTDPLRLGLPALAAHLRLLRAEAAMGMVPVAAMEVATMKVRLNIRLNCEKPDESHRSWMRRG